MKKKFILITPILYAPFIPQINVHVIWWKIYLSSKYYKRENILSCDRKQKYLPSKYYWLGIEFIYETKKDFAKVSRHVSGIGKLISDWNDFVRRLWFYYYKKFKSNFTTLFP